MKRGTTLMALEVETGAHEPDRSPSETPRKVHEGTHASKSPGAGTSNAQAGPIPALNADRDVQDHAAQTAVSTDLSTVREITVWILRGVSFQLAVDRGLASWKLTPLISGTVLGKLSLPGKPPPPAIGLLLAPLS